MADFLNPVWLNVGGVRIAGFERRGSGTPIVLMHGAGGNALWFRALADALFPRPVSALDMPGHGYSAQASSWEIEDLAELMFKAVSRRWSGNVIWGGHSWGAKVAAMIAATHPEAAQALILLDPSPASGLAVPTETFVDMTFGGELGPWNSLAAAKDSVRCLPQYANWSQDLERAFERGVVRRPDAQWRARVSRRTLLAICRAAGKDHSAVLRKVGCPALLLIADQSLAWQEPTNFAVFSHAVRVVIGSNHWLMSGNPEALHRAVGDWLNAGAVSPAVAA